MPVIASEISVQLEILNPAEPEAEREPQSEEEMPEWEFLAMYKGEGESVLLVDYPKVAKKGTLIGAGDLVTAATTINFRLDYPLENPVGVTAQCPNGFTPATAIWRNRPDLQSDVRRGQAGGDGPLLQPPEYRGGWPV
jgi:hypothetical protein